MWDFRKINNEFVNFWGARSEGRNIMWGQFARNWLGNAVSYTYKVITDRQFQCIERFGPEYSWRRCLSL